MEAFAVKYTVLLNGQAIAPLYGGVRYLPQTFLIDRNGRIVSHARGIRDKMTLAVEVRAIVE